MLASAHGVSIERVARGSASHLEENLGDVVFINGLRWRGAIELEEVPECYPDQLRDAAAILDMVERHQGKASSSLARHWLKRLRRVNDLNPNRLFAVFNHNLEPRNRQHCRPAIMVSE